MKPAYLYATITDEDHISLKWKWYGSRNDVAGFKIERRAVDIVDFTIIASTSDYFYIDEDIPQDKKRSFIYRVHAFKGSVISGYSNEVRVDIGPGEIAANPTDAGIQKEVQSNPTRGPAATRYEEVNPGPTSTPIRKTEPGTVWFVPDSLRIQTEAFFTTGVHVNSGTQKIAAFGIIIEYSDALLDVNRNIGNNGVIPGSDGFIAAVNARDPGVLFVSGFDSYGKGPGEDLHLLSIQWRALNNGVSKLSLTIRDLNDVKTAAIKNLKTIDGLVTIVKKEHVAEPEIAYWDERWSTEPPYDPGMNRDEGNSYENRDHYDDDDDDYDDYDDHYDDDDYDDYDDDDYDDDDPYPDNRTAAPYRTSPPQGDVTSAPYDPDSPIDNPTQRPTQTNAPTRTQVTGRTGTPTATPRKTRAPTATPTVKPVRTAPPAGQEPGDVWIVPSSQIVYRGSSFITEVHVNTGSQKLHAYGIHITFSTRLIKVKGGSNGVEAGPDGFLAAVNVQGSVLKMAGFDTSGKGPKSDLYLLAIHWIADAENTGNATLMVDVENLVDNKTNPVGIPRGKNGTVTVQ